MGRSVVVRKSYHEEISKLNRLGKSVESDPRGDQGWKDETLRLVSALKAKLLEFEIAHVNGA